MSRPLMIDLFAGLGGWTEGGLAEGYDVIGFDIERHRYPARVLPDAEGRKVAAEGVDFNNPKAGSSKNRSFDYANECAMRDAPLTGGWIEYPAQLVIQDVLTLHGSQFKNATLIVASPPCQEYSYMAMPWSRAKAIAAEYRSGTRDVKKLTALFDACFRIQREACEAAGRHIPLVVENVKGAQPWVGRARWSYGSFFLWGDVPALMPMTTGARKGIKPVPNRGWTQGCAITLGVENYNGPHEIKNTGGSWFNIAHNTTSGKGRNPVEALGRKQPGLSGVRENGKGDRWFQDGAARHGSKSSARKFASAMIAKIPAPLARHVARIYRPC